MKDCIKTKMERNETEQANKCIYSQNNQQQQFSNAQNTVDQSRAFTAGSISKIAKRSTEFFAMCLLVTSLMMLKPKAVNAESAEKYETGKSTVTTTVPMFSLDEKRSKDIIANSHLKDGVGLEGIYYVPTPESNGAKNENYQSNGDSKTNKAGIEGIVKAAINVGDNDTVFLTVNPYADYTWTNYEHVDKEGNTYNYENKDESTTKTMYVPMTLTFPLGRIGSEIGGGIIFGSRTNESDQTTNIEISRDVGTITFSDGSYMNVKQSIDNYYLNATNNDRFVGWTFVLLGKYYRFAYNYMKGERYYHEKQNSTSKIDGSYCDSNGTCEDISIIINNQKDMTLGPRDIKRYEWNFSVPLMISRGKGFFTQTTIVPQYKYTKEVLEANEYWNKEIQRIHEIAISIRQMIADHLIVGLRASHVIDYYDVDYTNNGEKNTKTEDNNIAFTIGAKF
jgi:hypothetical protein